MKTTYFVSLRTEGRKAYLLTVSNTLIHCGGVSTAEKLSSQWLEHVTKAVCMTVDQELGKEGQALRSRPISITPLSSARSQFLKLPSPLSSQIVLPAGE